MSIPEQESFISSIHPFESLTINQLELFVENIDIAYFKENEIIQKQNCEPTHLYFILKGLIQEKQEDEVLSLYSKNEIFDSISLIENYSKNVFVTVEETICYILPRDIFIKNFTWKLYIKKLFFPIYLRKISNNINNENNKEMANIMVAK